MNKRLCGVRDLSFVRWARVTSHSSNHMLLYAISSFKYARTRLQTHVIICVYMHECAYKAHACLQTPHQLC